MAATMSAGPGFDQIGYTEQDDYQPRNQAKERELPSLSPEAQSDNDSEDDPESGLDQVAGSFQVVQEFLRSDWRKPSFCQGFAPGVAHATRPLR